jgi:hypothetical protein
MFQISTINFSTKPLNMKKYIIPIVAFVLIAGAVNAQAPVKKASTDKPAAKMNKPATKASTTTAAVTPSTPAAAPAKKTDAAAIPRKQHKKSKSVKPVSK